MFIAPATAFTRPGCDAAMPLRLSYAAGSAASIPDTRMPELEQALFSGSASRVIANSQMVKREAEE